MHEEYFEILGFDAQSSQMLIGSIAKKYNVKIELDSQKQNDESNAHILEDQINGILKATSTKENLTAFFKELQTMFKNKLLVGDIAQFLVTKLMALKLKICTCESYTGGKISQMITQIKGASNVFNGGIVAYSIESKKNILHIEDDVFKSYGVYSSKCVMQMAQSALNIFNADIAISTSGISSQDNSKNNFLNLKVGQGFICILFRNKLPIVIEDNFAPKNIDSQNFENLREIIIKNSAICAIKNAILHCK